MTGPLFLDVTDFGSIQRLTGVQRLVIELAKAVEDVKLVYFLDDDHFVVLPEVLITERVDPEISNNRAWLRLLNLQRLGQHLSSATTVLFPSLRLRIQNVMRFLYGVFLSPIRLRTNMTDGQPVRNVNEICELWVLYIPRDVKHLNRLLRFARSEQFRVGVYVYDLIPHDQPLLLKEPVSQEETRLFQQYLQLVSESNKIRCLSQFTRDRLLRWWSAEMPGRSRPVIEVLYPPLRDYYLRLQSLGDDKVARMNTRRRLGLKVEPRLVLAVAPLNRRKNLIVVLRAVSRMLKRGVQICLVIVAPVRSDNDQETIGEATKLAKEFPQNVRILTPVSENLYLQLLDACDVVAIPSRLEGYGLPCLEGSARNKQVVTSDASALLEIGPQFGASIASADSVEDWLTLLLRTPSKKANWQLRPFTTHSEFKKKLLD